MAVVRAGARDAGVGGARFRILTGRQPDVVPAKLELGREALAVLDAHLAENDYLLGDRISLADVSVFAYAHVAPDAGLALPPNVARWVRRSRRSPASSTTSCRTRRTRASSAGVDLRLDGSGRLESRHGGSRDPPRPDAVLEAWELQRSSPPRSRRARRPDTVVFLEHPPVVTLGRRTDDGELHVPAGAEVEVVETDRGGKSTFHGPGQLVCYPILDLNRHGRDVRRYCRDLEEALIRTLAAFGLEVSGSRG